MRLSTDMSDSLKKKKCDLGKKAKGYAHIVKLRTWEVLKKSLL